MANVSREKFSLSFSSELLKVLRRVAHERSMSDKYTPVNELVEEAVELWYSPYEPSTEKPLVHRKTSSPSGMVSIVVPQGEEEWHRKVSHVFTGSGRKALEANIEFFDHATHMEEQLREVARGESGKGGKKVQGGQVLGGGGSEGVREGSGGSDLDRIDERLAGIEAEAESDSEQGTPHRRPKRQGNRLPRANTDSKKGQGKTEGERE